MDLVLAGAATLYLAKNFALYKKDRQYREYMERLEKARNFDMDYLPEVDALPKDKDVCLRGKFVGDMDSSLVDPEEKVALSRISVFQQESEDIRELEGDSYVVSLWHHMIANKGPFYLENDKGELILLDVVPTQETILHNTFIVKSAKDFSDPEFAKGLLTGKSPEEAEFKKRIMPEAIRKVLKNQGETYEMGLRSGDCYNFLGNATKYDSNLHKLPNPKNANLIFRSSIITGEMKENVMRYIDNRIMKTSKQMRSNIGMMVAFSSAALVYRGYLKPAFKEWKLSRSSN